MPNFIKAVSSQFSRKRGSHQRAANYTKQKQGPHCSLFRGMDGVGSRTHSAGRGMGSAMIRDSNSAISFSFHSRRWTYRNNMSSVGYQRGPRLRATQIRPHSSPAKCPSQRQ